MLTHLGTLSSLLTYCVLTHFDYVVCTLHTTVGSSMLTLCDSFDHPSSYIVLTLQLLRAHPFRSSVFIRYMLSLLAAVCALFDHHLRNSVLTYLVLRVHLFGTPCSLLGNPCSTACSPFWHSVFTLEVLRSHTISTLFSPLRYSVLIFDSVSTLEVLRAHL